MVLSMSKWVGKVAVVTGASSGIGKEIARELVRQGVTVVGVARRVHLIEELAKETRNEKGKLYALKCDVQLGRRRDNLSEPVYIMINNAGVFGHTNLIDGDASIWKNVLDTNVFGLCLGTREAVRNMRANNVEVSGGHVIPYFYSSNVYPASKHAVTALTETIRREFAANKVNIKITVSTKCIKSVLSMVFNSSRQGKKRANLLVFSYIGAGVVGASDLGLGAEKFHRVPKYYI
ncbi:hypothetical protein NQ317_016175 [Molorchus minor]|uniref:Dehydrogenase/reductase SDR family member 11 n=1 Tax=Molorchus minor TaxID=1323400 RepID=A0ABQ9JRA6_9CUCU|nr:hypothetical protein NQ317_016175 [Molorchus minor]